MTPTLAATPVSGPPARQAAPALAAATAVAGWSVKPLLIHALDGLDALTVFLAAGAIGCGCSAVIWSTMRLRHTTPAVNDRRSFWTNAAVSGLFLAGWYLCFYRALALGPAVEVTIVAFTWPLIALLATPVIAHRRHTWTAQQWVLLLVAFAGTGLVVLAANGGGGGGGLWWAGAAAVSSGLYLPFAVKAQAQIRGGPATRTFCAITAANGAALACVSVFAAATGRVGELSALSAQQWLLCALIGAGIYLCAEVAWTWGFSASSSIAIAGLPYLSPALSVLLLALVLGRQVSVLTIVGVTVIIAANITLNLSPTRSATTPPAQRAVLLSWAGGVAQNAQLHAPKAR